MRARGIERVDVMFVVPGAGGDGGDGGAGTV